MTPELFFGHTDTGKQRDNNEDAFIAETLQGGRLIAACVIDGVGGYEGGEVAAAIAKETIRETLKQDISNPVESMKSAFLLANQKIYDERMANKERDSMACVLTLALVDLTNNQFHYAHVGDTRLYLFRDNSLVKLTKDHSFVGFLEDNKKLSEEEAMRHPKRNEINKALGFNPNMSSVADYIETGSSPFLPGDMLLLCSDGLSDMIDSQSMISILSSAKTVEQKTKLLIDAANHAGGKDNITVVLVHNNKKPVKQRATKPTLVKKKHSPTENDEEQIKDTPVVLVKKTGTGGILFLTMLCLLLGAAVFYLWKHPREADPAPVSPAPPAIVKKRNANEQKLLDSLQGNNLLFINDTIYGKTIIVTDTILVRKDSLHLNAHGVVLQSDSSYHGPAFVIDSSCRYVLLENIVLENFDIGVLSRNKNLLFKNVQFRNCRVPVQSNFYPGPNGYVTGRIVDSILFRTDSLPKK